MKSTAKYIDTLRNAIALYNKTIAKDGSIERVEPSDLAEVIAEERMAVERIDIVKVKEESLKVDFGEFSNFFVKDMGFASLFIGWADQSEKNPKGEWGEVADELRKLRAAINERMVELAKILMPKNDVCNEQPAKPKPHQGESKEDEHKSFVWIMSDAEKGVMTKYTPKERPPYRTHYRLLKESGAIDEDMDLNYFIDAVTRAEFGMMYAWAGENNAKTKIRAYVHKLATKYFCHGRDKEYMAKAAESMGITGRQLSRYKITKDFSENLDKEI